MMIFGRVTRFIVYDNPVIKLLVHSNSAFLAKWYLVGLSMISDSILPVKVASPEGWGRARVELPG